MSFKIPEVNSEEIVNLAISKDPDSTTDYVKEICHDRVHEEHIQILKKITVQILDVRESDELEFCNLNELLTGEFDVKELSEEDINEIVNDPDFQTEESKVLTPSNYIFSHIPVDKLLKIQDPGDLEEGIDFGFNPIFEDYPVFCLCRSGYRSTAAQVHLQKLGFQALNIRGGMIGIARYLGRRIKL